MARQDLEQVYQKLKAGEKYINQTRNNSNIDALVQEVRQKVYTSIFNRCSKMRVLGIYQPVDLHDIYTNVNILEQVSSHRRLEIADILKASTVDEFERPGLGGCEQRLPGLTVVKQCPKLIVLGKPGAGKTTFLKNIAIQCILGKFQSHLVPIFITLKDFAETAQCLSLLQYITKQFAASFVDDSAVEQLLSQGKAIILLDGLDEVMEADAARLLQEINIFSAQFTTNSFVITCRIAAREYIFDNFTEVEVADFDEEQIVTFVNKWFSTKDSTQTTNFIDKFTSNHSIRELGTNPLLLTLLCLTFEELAGFPVNRLELYQEGLNLLLKKWDAIRQIERDQVYKKLTVQQKQDLLSRIALITFERGEYFFKQQELEQYITDYIRHLRHTSDKTEVLQIESGAVLESMEAQHGLLVERARGIYSFSHLTFHEYYAAKEIVTNSDPQFLEAALQQLVSRINQKRWREVFLLTVSMLRNGDYFLQLFKQQIDNLIIQDQSLNFFLNWLSQKAIAVNVTYKVAVIRAFYFELSLGIDLKIFPTQSLALKLDPSLSLALKRELELDLELNFALNLAYSIDFNLTPSLSLSLERASNLSLDLELQRLLQQLKEQLPKLDQSENSFKKWWKVNGDGWVDQLRFLQVKYRNINHNWQFSPQQRQALQQYYDGNKLLWDCINSASYMTQVVRQKLEETLLLPLAIGQKKS